jgi:hypothetical protein
MKKKLLRIQLPAEVCPALLDLLLPLAAAENSVSTASGPDLNNVDEDLREAWRADLAAHLSGDLGRFGAVFGTTEFRESGEVDIADDDCEPLLRAASSLRLQLRDKRLTAIADAALETGEIDPGRLNRDEQQAMVAYMVLATLQEIIVHYLDSGADAAAE